MKGHYKLAFWLSLGGTVSSITTLVLALTGIRDAMPTFLSGVLSLILTPLFYGGFVSYFIGFGFLNTVKLSFWSVTHLGDAISGGFSDISDLTNPGIVFDNNRLDGFLLNVSATFSVLGLLAKIFFFFLWFCIFLLLTFVTYLLAYIGAKANS